MLHLWTLVLQVYLSLVAAQQCYYGPGLAADDTLVPCGGEGHSTCCLQGDTCLSGNACFDYTWGNTYQYGCTDPTYQDPSCPFKCGWNATLSPWVGMNYCDDLPGTGAAWVCESPESCGCVWEPFNDMLKLPQRDCREMGYEARVALFAPPTIAPFLQLPATSGGSKIYFKGTTINGVSTWISTAVPGYTPFPISPLASYDSPTSIIILDRNAIPSPATMIPAHILGVTPSAPTTPVSFPTGPGDSPTTSSTPSTTTTTRAISPTSSTSSSTAARSTTSTAIAATSPNSSQSSTPNTALVASPSTPQSIPGTTSGSVISSSSAAATGNTLQDTSVYTDTSSGLSTGAKAGIGAGIGIGGVIAIAAAILFPLRRRLRRRPLSDMSELSSQPMYGGDDEKEKQQWGFSPRAPYMDSPRENDHMLPQSPVELHGRSSPGPNHVYELHGNSSPPVGF